MQRNVFVRVGQPTVLTFHHSTGYNVVLFCVCSTHVFIGGGLNVLQRVDHTGHTTGCLHHKVVVLRLFGRFTVDHFGGRLPVSLATNGFTTMPQRGTIYPVIYTRVGGGGLQRLRAIIGNTYSFIATTKERGPFPVQRFHCTTTQPKVVGRRFTTRETSRLSPPNVLYHTRTHPLTNSTHGGRIMSLEIVTCRHTCQVTRGQGFFATGLRYIFILVVVRIRYVSLPFSNTVHRRTTIQVRATPR